jgi:G patch domain-containing protein 1
MRRLKPNTVTDEQGRQRFHGAFTGGFSAGYFNSVGSAEGFKPAQFKSSRSNRAEKVSRAVTDYMDAEDGLLGGQLWAKENLDSFRAKSSESFGDDPTIEKLKKQFVLEPSNTIGKRILAKLGWKPGVAVGPRKKKVNYFDDPEIAVAILKSGNLPASSIENGQITFGERYEGDLVPKKRVAWLGTRGVGYEAEENPSAQFGSISTNDPTESNRYHVRDLFNKSSKGGTIPKEQKQRIGHRTLNPYMDDEEDVAFENVDSYQTEYSKEAQDAAFDNDMDQFHGYRTQKSAASSPVTVQRCPTDGKPVLPGFVLAKEPLQVQEFPLPDIPRDFRPRPQLIFSQFATSSSGTVSGHDSMKRFDERKKAWEIPSQEPPVSQPQQEKSVSSVFDLLKPADRERILNLAQKSHAAVTENNNRLSDASMAPTPTEAAAAHQTSSSDARPMLVPPSLLQHSSFANLAAQFKSRFTSASEATLRSQQHGHNASLLQAGMLSADVFKEKLAQSQSTLESATQISQAVNTQQNQLPKCEPRRSEIVWIPSPLLSKRMQIKTEDASGARLSAIAAPPATSSSGTSNISAKSTTTNVSKLEISEADRAAFQAENVYLQPASVGAMSNQGEKSSLAKFRSIFEDSEDEEDEGEDEKETNEGGDKEKIEVPRYSVDNQAVSANQTTAPSNTSVTVISKSQEPVATNMPTSQYDNLVAINDLSPPALPTFVPRSQRMTSLPSSSTNTMSTFSSRPKNLNKSVRKINHNHNDDDEADIEVDKSSQVGTNLARGIKKNDSVHPAEENVEDEELTSASLLRKRRLPQHGGGVSVGIVSAKAPNASEKKRTHWSKVQDDSD